MSEYSLGVLENAIKAGKLHSVRSLGSSFPADPQRAGLAYAQSNSLVTYLIETYGWDKIRDILAVFKEGATYDGVVKKVYGFGITELDNK